MLFSFSSLINVTGICILLIAIIYFIIKSRNILTSIYSTLFLGFILVLMLRFCLPFEFNFTRTIPITIILPEIYHFFTNKIFKIPFLSYSILDLLNLCWIVGSIIVLIRISVLYYQNIHLIASLKQVNKSELNSLCDKIVAGYKWKKTFMIVENNHIATPMIFGVFRSYIVVPPVSLTKSEWNYVLQHEINHYYKGHLFFKIFCEILCALYWWNPFVYLLKRMINQLMELNVDYTVTARMSAEEKIEYSNCLLKVAKIQVLHRQIELSHLGITFNDEKTTTISKRIISIMHAMEKPAKTALVSCFVIFAVGSIFLLSSFCFILEPSSIPELVEEKTFGFDSKHNFFISNEDGSYDLYIDNQYVLTVDEPFDSTATIYSNIKEVPFYEDKMQ